MSKQPTIETVETVLVDIPTIRPHELSMTTMRGQTLLIVRILTSDGVVGLGEGTTIGGLAYGAESPEGMKLAIDTILPRCSSIAIRTGSASPWQKLASLCAATILPNARSRRRCSTVCEAQGATA